MKNVRRSLVILVATLLCALAGAGTAAELPPKPLLSVNDVTLIEGTGDGTATAVFTISMDDVIGQSVSVDFATSDGTATAPADYLATSGTATISPGTSSTTVSVPIVRDALNEFNETFTLTISNSNDQADIDPEGATGTATIDDDDAPPAVSVGSTSVVEGDSGAATLNVPVTLSAPSGRPVTVRYATSGATATGGVDFTPVTTERGIVNIPPGQTSGVAPVQVEGDTFEEPDETFTVTLSEPGNATLGASSAQQSITDDDEPPVLTIANASVGERDMESSTLVFGVALSAPAEKIVRVGYATADGSATDADYTPAAGTVTFAPGSTIAIVEVVVAGDTRTEADETLAVILSAPENATIDPARARATGTIVDDDALATEPVRPDIGISDVKVAEGDTGTTPAVFTVSLSVPTTAAVTMKYATADGTAVGGDYDPLSGTLTFNPGERTKTITVTVRGDKLDESDETFSLRLSDAAGGVLAKAGGLAVITDDDVTRVAPRITATTTPKRDRTRGYRFTTSGRLTHPASVRRADACAGKVQVRFKAGRKTISTRRVSLDRNCRFTRTVVFGIRSRLRPGRLKVEVRFLGNAVLLPKSARIRYVRAG